MSLVLLLVGIAGVILICLQRPTRCSLCGDRFLRCDERITVDGPQISYVAHVHCFDARRYAR